MRLHVNHPELASDLVRALNETDCAAARVAADVVEVVFPWLRHGDSAAHAATELLFFVSAWAAEHPTFRATVLETG